MLIRWYRHVWFAWKNGSLQDMAPDEVVASAEVLSQKYPEDLETELSTVLGYFAKFAQTSSARKLESSHAGKTGGKTSVELHMYEMS